MRSSHGTVADIRTSMFIGCHAFRTHHVNHLPQDACVAGDAGGAGDGPRRGRLVVGVGAVEEGLAALVEPRVLEDEAAAGVALERGLAGGDAVVHIEAGRECGRKRPRSVAVVNRIQELRS